jgi:hypothetical protein
MSNGRAPRSQEARSILQCFHRPTFDTACLCSRRLNLMRSRRSGDSCSYGCQNRDKDDESDPLVRPERQ